MISRLEVTVGDNNLKTYKGDPDWVETVYNMLASRFIVRVLDVGVAVPDEGGLTGLLSVYVKVAVFAEFVL
jgi:hypothetical protein